VSVVCGFMGLLLGAVTLVFGTVALALGMVTLVGVAVVGAVASVGVLAAVVTTTSSTLWFPDLCVSERALILKTSLMWFIFHMNK